MSEVIQHNGQKEILLLSLGTGTTTAKDKLGGIFELACQGSWLLEHIGVVSEAVESTDMTHYYLATIFPGLLPADNYLRIQVHIARFFCINFSIYTYNRIKQNKK